MFLWHALGQHYNCHLSKILNRGYSNWIDHTNVVRKLHVKNIAQWLRRLAIFVDVLSYPAIFLNLHTCACICASVTLCLGGIKVLNCGT